MPRSVNAVASRARRKKILKAHKGYFGKGSNVFWTVPKTSTRKDFSTHTETEKAKKRI